MEYCTLSRCLMCRKPILQNLSKDSENLVSTAHLLQSFLNCFQINVLDSGVHDLSTSCRFCPTCEQFVTEWSSTQTMMTQLTQRAAQLKATLSALLLTAPQIQKQGHNDEDVTNIINNRIQNSQEVELSLLLQQTVDDIRNELQKKYSVNVMVEKMQPPCQPSKLNQEELDPLSGHCDNDDEPMDDWRSDDGSDAEYSSSGDQMDNEEKSEQIFETSSKTEEETSSDDSDDSVELNEMKVNPKLKTRTKVVRKSDVPSQKKPLISKFFIPDGPNRFKYEGMSFQLNEEDQTFTCDECGFRSSPTARSIQIHILHHLKKLTHGKVYSEKRTEKRQKYPKKVVPDGPNKFKYNGHGLKLNEEDQCYYCDACDFKGNTVVHSVLLHIREIHFTEEEKQNLTAVQISDTEWVYGGEYKIIRVGEKLKCVSCGFVDATLYDLNYHIRTTHVGIESADKVAPLQVTNEPSVKDLTPIEGTHKSVPYTFYPAENKYTCGICQAKLSSARRNIIRHINERHTDAALSVICELCGKELSNQRGYKWHMKKHQTEPKNCPTCNKKFYCSRSFNQHLKIHVHGDAAKKHQCEYCGEKFFRSVHYRQHVRMHTGETPYECGDCGMKFRLVAVLSGHRQKVHGVQKGSARNMIRINE